jgi:hypothetical protein
MGAAGLKRGKENSNNDRCNSHSNSKDKWGFFAALRMRTLFPRDNYLPAVALKRASGNDAFAGAALDLVLKLQRGAVV